jgi:LPXTG-motif cell wall-anchored protein
MSEDLLTALQTWAASDTAIVSATAEGASTLVFDGLPYGYYVVTTSVGTAPITVNSANPTVEIIDKHPDDPGQSETTDFKKVDSTDENVAVGENAGYTITYYSVNYATKNQKAVKEYTIEDTPTNLKIDPTTVVVKVGEDTLSANETAQVTTETNDDNEVVKTTYAFNTYTIVYDNVSGVMTITIPWSTKNSDDTYTFNYATSAVVSIKYDAEVLHGAVADTNAQAKNKVKITYATHDGGSGNVNPEPGTDETVQTKAATILKTDAYNNTLTGATFQIFAGTSTTAMKVVQEKMENGTVIEGVYHKADSDEIADGLAVDTVTVASATNATTGAVKGEIVIKGLDFDTTYTVKETVAPEGYNLLTEPQTIDKDGDNFALLTVINTTGGTLPSTGGMGTTIFYVAGGILVVAALVVLITKKRMDAQN